MSRTTWLCILDELAIIVVCIAMLLTVALGLALHDVEPRGRSREARRWGGVSASVFTLAFSVIGKHVPQGMAGEAFDVLVAAGFFFGFPFGVLLWYLLRFRGDSTPGARLTIVGGGRES